MLQNPIISTVVFITFLSIFASENYANGNDVIYEQITNKSLNDILEDIEFALTENNLRIVDRLHIGQAIKSRGNPDFPDYEIILYCDLTFAKKILELEPELINACPGKITVRSNGSSYIISAPLWPEHYTNHELRNLMFNINDILRKVVDYAILDWLKI
jgi:uncharacterized protein (DUF302 family)